MSFTELSQATKLKALLVHVMGEEPTENRPHLRGRTIVWAANYLAYAHEIPQLVFAGHHFWLREDRPPLSIMTAEESERDLKAAKVSKKLTALATYPDKVGGEIVNKPVTETSGEVIAFLAYCQELGIYPEEVGSISSKTHVASIEDIYRKRDVKTPHVFAAEDVLLSIPGEVGVQAYLAMIQEINASADERNFRIKEKIKRLVYWLPFANGEARLRAHSDKQRKISSYPQEVVHIQT